MSQDRAQLLITAVDQTRSAFDSIRTRLTRLGEESNRVKGLLAGLGASLSVVGFATSVRLTSSPVRTRAAKIILTVSSRIALIMLSNMS